MPWPSASTAAIQLKDRGMGVFGSKPITPIIFESNFANDAGYSLSNQGVWTQANVPEGWNGAICSGGTDNGITVESGLGIGGSNALKFKYDTVISQPTATLLKHLTSNQNTGFGELYIRYHIRLPNNFKVGDGVSSVPYWKWGRLHQNTHPTDQSQWTENRADSYYVVWNWNGSPTFGVKPAFTFAANESDAIASERELGSAGGPRCKVDWGQGGGVIHADTEGYWSHMPGWEIDWTTNPGFLLDQIAQSWHTYEIHIKAATSEGADDGVCEFWFDGVHQGVFKNIDVSGYSSPGNPLPNNYFSGIPTVVNGSGWNMFYLFDNLSVWNADWDQPGVDGFILVNDVVVSTSRIGHNYVAGSVS